MPSAPDPDSQHYDLHRTYEHESTLERYTRLTVGEGAPLTRLLWHELVLGICTGLPGALGLGLRGMLYPLLFAGMTRGAHVGRQVTLRCPRQVHLERGVLVDDFAAVCHQRQYACQVPFVNVPFYVALRCVQPFC